MLNIEYTHETIQKLAEGMNEYLHIDLSTPMTLEKLTKAIIGIGIDIEYVNITDANNPLFVISAEYKKRGCRDYVIRINKNKDEKDLIFQVAAEFGKIILYELPEDIEETSKNVKFYFGEKSWTNEKVRKRKVRHIFCVDNTYTLNTANGTE